MKATVMESEKAEPEQKVKVTVNIYKHVKNVLKMLHFFFKKKTKMAEKRVNF